MVLCVVDAGFDIVLSSYPFLCHVGWLIDSERPGKQFFSHFVTEPPLPGYYQYFGK